MKKLYIALLVSMLAPLFATGQLSGDKIVPSDNYPTLQAVVDSLNTQGIAESGVRFFVSGNETFTPSPLTITASGNEDGRIELVWNGQGAKPIINFSATEAASEAGFTLSGSDYVTFEGLDIRSADGLLEYGILITNATATNGAHYNVVRNCVITLNKENVNQTEAVRVGPAIVAETLEGSTNHNKFYNNTIQNTFIGYSFDGSNSNTLLMSVGNEVGTEDDGQSTVSDLVMCGVLIDDQNGFRLFNTTIQDLTRIGSGTTAPAAVSTMSGNPSEPLTNSFEIYNNRIENITSSFTSSYGLYFSARKSTHNVYNNIVNGVTATGGGSNTADGIMVFGTDMMANIFNNMVSGIAAPASAVSGNAATRGINVRSYLRAQIYYNSVFLNFAATNEAHSSAAICVYNNNDSVDMRNNIFVNLTTFPENPTGRAAAFYKRTPALDNMVLSTDNNIYYAGTPSENNPIFYGHNSTAPAIDQTLDAYKTRAASFDQGSFTENVPFLSEADLHVQPLATSVARENASPISIPFAILTDIDGSVRSTETPDIGADEIANPYPAIATEPNPGDMATDVPVQLASVGWKYSSSPEFVNPDAFKVYKNTSSDFNGVQPHATIQYVEGQEEYSVGSMAGVSLQHYTTYYWKVVPTLNEDTRDVNPDIPVWSFTTEKYPYPNQAENLRPAANDTVVLFLTRDTTMFMSFDFIPQEEYVLPTAFKLVLSTVENGTKTPKLETIIDFVSGQTHYSFYPMELFELVCETSYTWQVIPTVDAFNGPETPDVVEIPFFVTCWGAINERNLSEFEVYPNPTTGIVCFEQQNIPGGTLQIYDVTGRIRMQTTLETGQNTINLSQLENGFYVGRWTGNSQIRYFNVQIAR